MNAPETPLEEKKATARTWFEHLRHDIVAAFEKLEAGLLKSAPHGSDAPGHFIVTPWARTDYAWEVATAAAA